MGRKGVDRLATVLWSWWKSRNGVLFGEKLQAFDQIVNEGLSLHNSYKAANSTTIPRASSAQQEEGMATYTSKWKLPPRGRLKLNCDAAWVATEKKGAVGGLIRTDTGRFCGAFFQQVPACTSALVAEALALRAGLEFGASQGWRHLDVESDSEALIKSIMGSFSGSLEIDVLVEDIRHQASLLDATF